MPVTFTEMCADDLVPMRAVYQRTKATPEDVAKARAEALQEDRHELFGKGLIYTHISSNRCFIFFTPPCRRMIILSGSETNQAKDPQASSEASLR